jgi:predicted NACHT family NTPase
MEVLPGSALRDHIARFLRLKYSTVEIEKRLTSTTADVLFVDDTNHLFKQVIAVEAKDWAKPLSSSNIAKIFNDYKPSIDLNEIDHLWIIGRHSLSSSQIETLSRLRVVKYSSLDEFNTSLMNFTNLITHNILSFTHHEVFDNYISTRSLDRNISMDAVVDEWLTSDARGLMVFGGYGIGKTTYSLYLAKRYSEKYQSDPSSRIPVRISLGGFYTKQDLIGLICAVEWRGDGVQRPKFLLPPIFGNESKWSSHIDSRRL